MPTELDESSRKIRQLQIEKVALQKETDESSKKRLAALEEELKQEQASFDAMKAKWDEEKKGIAEAKSLKERLEKARFDLQTKFQAGDYQAASKLQYQDIPALEKRLKDLTEASQGADRLVNEVVDEEEIAKIVARMTGIPVSRIEKGDREKVLELE